MMFATFLYVQMKNLLSSLASSEHIIKLLSFLFAFERKLFFESLV